MRVTHLITGLGVGGAELALAQLIESKGPGDEVISLKPLGSVANKIRSTGTHCWSLNLRKKREFLGAAQKLRRHLQKHKTDVLVTWLYHANLLGSAATAMSSVQLVWNIRGSQADESGKTNGHDIVQRLSAYLSNKSPSSIIAVSHSAKKAHLEYGYDEKKMTVIENGVCGNRFRANASARQSFREKLSLNKNTLLIGHVGRLSPMKDHANLFAAYEKVKFEFANRFQKKVSLVCIGTDVSLLEKSAPADVFLLPTMSKIHEAYPAFDVLALSSCSEGFPNVLAEAMACEINVVSTDVGDAAQMIRDQNLLVPIKNTPALANALATVLNWPKPQQAQEAAANRTYILEKFSTQKMTDRYWKLLRSVSSQEKESESFQTT